MPAASLPSCQVHEATASTVLAPKVHKRISSFEFLHAIAVPEMMLVAASALAAEERHPMSHVCVQSILATIATASPNDVNSGQMLLNHLEPSS